MRRGCSAPGVGSSAGVGCGSRGRKTEEIEAGGPSVAGLLVGLVDCSYAGALAIVAENGDASAVRAADVAAAVLAGMLAAFVLPVA